jgi:hypothetical protein
MGGVRVRRIAAAVALSLTLLLGRPAHAQTAQAAPPPAREEIGSELSADEQAKFAQLRSAIGTEQQAALFELLDQLPIGARGAFVADLLDQNPQQRANILGFLARLTPAQRSGIAELILSEERNGQRQWDNFFRYVGSVPPGEAVAKMFVPTEAEPQMIWRTLPGGVGRTEECSSEETDRSCVWDFYVPGPGIVGGRSARNSPWQVELYRFDVEEHPYTPEEVKWEWRNYGQELPGFQRLLMCGGALLPGNWVLTAAHCIKANTGVPLNAFLTTRRVRTGTRFLDESFAQSMHEAPGTTWRISAAVVHAGYGRAGSGKGDDIALLKIEPDKKTRPSDNRLAGPIALPAKGATLPAGAKLLVTGWGATTETPITNGLYRDRYGKAKMASVGLLEADLNNVPLAQCAANPNFRQVQFSPQPGQICALGEQGSDTCQGDSGGPLVRYTKRGPVLVGLVSFGPGCGLDHTPGIYTDVAYFRDWIAGAMKQAKPGQVIKWEQAAPAGKAGR